MTKSKLSTKTKSRKTIFRDAFIAVGILAVSFLPYVHDLDFFRGMEGFSGFSSLRIGVYFVAMFVVALSGWIAAFLLARGKSFRFAILAPIFMLGFQLTIYLLDARKSTVNDFNYKVLVNLLVGFVLIMLYFYGLKKRGDAE